MFRSLIPTVMHELLLSYLNWNTWILQDLVTLEIETVSLHQIKNILIASRLLRYLKFNVFRSLTRTMTIADWTELKAGFSTFQLEKLSMSLTHEPCDVAQILETQMQLEELEILYFFLSSRMIKVISKMKKLKSLTLKNNYLDELQLIFNNVCNIDNMPSLISFNIKGSPWTNYRPIINVAHHLISLSIEDFDQEFINFAGLKLKQLKQLRVSYLKRISDISNKDLFPALEELYIQDPIQTDQRRFLLHEIDHNPTTNFLRCFYNEMIQPRHNRY